MSETQSEARIVVVCDVCGGVDSAPRHVIDYTGAPLPGVDPTVIARVSKNSNLDEATLAGVIADVMDTTVQRRHLDCCADAGCPDGSCNIIHATSPGKRVLKDDALVAFLTSGKVDDVGTKLNDERSVAAENGEVG